MARVERLPRRFRVTLTPTEVRHFKQTHLAAAASLSALKQVWFEFADGSAGSAGQLIDEGCAPAYGGGAHACLGYRATGTDGPFFDLMAAAKCWGAEQLGVQLPAYRNPCARVRWWETLRWGQKRRAEQPLFGARRRRR